jgi:epoxyqueuosine reductase
MVVMTDVNSLITDEAVKFVRETPLNRLPAFNGEPIFGAPLVGFAAGEDPLFTDYKRIIGRLHMTPYETMRRYSKLNGISTAVKAVSVIVWVLPFDDKVRRSVRAEKTVTSRRYNHARHLGDKVIAGLSAHLVGILQSYGHRAFSPEFSTLFRQYRRWGNARTTWSLRHIAYAAGLGTFSLNDALITPVGISHRLGSLVVDTTIPPSPKHYKDPFENCLYFREGSCGVCIKRCPAGALSEQGHDREKCGSYFRYEAPRILKKQGRSKEYIGRSVGCGLCQTGVPCEAGIPESLKRKD